MPQALAAAQQAVELAPDNPDAHFGLGIILFRDGQYDKAITEYREALRLTKETSNIDKAKTLNALADAYAAAGRLSEAIDAAEVSLNIALSAGQKDLAESIRKQLLELKARRTGQRQR
jgi:tetratricopeptide (TPR) repeat protein